LSLSKRSVDPAHRGRRYRTIGDVLKLPLIYIISQSFISTIPFSERNVKSEPALSPNRFSEWHTQQLVEIQLIRIMIGPHTDPYPFLVHIGKHSAQYPIPD